MELEIIDWNQVPYTEGWNRQTVLFDEIVAAKRAGTSYVNHIVFCEHPHVYTLGRSGKEANMLLGEEQLQRIGATLYHIDRGGDILRVCESVVPWRLLSCAGAFAALERASLIFPSNARALHVSYGGADMSSGVIP